VNDDEVLERIFGPLDDPIGDRQRPTPKHEAQALHIHRPIP